MEKEIRVLLSYHRYDIEWKDRIAKRLQESNIQVIEDEVTENKQSFDPNFQNLLTTFDLIILFISKKYLSLSNLIKKEIPEKILPFEKRGVRIIPIYIEDCSWLTIPWLIKIGVWPNDQFPFSTLNEEDKYVITSKLINELKAERAKYLSENSAHVTTYTNINADDGKIEIPVGQKYIPGEKEVSQLPRWTQVAFAARCARRVQPLFVACWPDAPQKHIDAINKAIDIAEKLAANAGANAEMADTYDSPYRTKNTFDSVAAADAADACVAATDNAAFAAAHVAASASASIAGTAADAAAQAANAASRLGNGEFKSRILIGICRDFETLNRLAQKNKWDDKTGVAPDVFGSLWPDGEPDWKQITKTQKNNKEDKSEKKKDLNYYTYYFESMGAAPQIIRTGKKITILNKSETLDAETLIQAIAVEGLKIKAKNTPYFFFKKFGQPQIIETINEQIETLTGEQRRQAESIQSITQDVMHILDRAKEVSETTTDTKKISGRHLIGGLIIYACSEEGSEVKYYLKKAGIETEKLKEEFLNYMTKDTDLFSTKPEIDSLTAWKKVLSDKEAAISISDFQRALDSDGIEICNRIIEIAQGEEHGLRVEVTHESYINLRPTGEKEKDNVAAQIHRYGKNERQIALAIVGQSKEIKQNTTNLKNGSITKGVVEELSGYKSGIPGEIAWLNGNLPETGAREQAKVYVITPEVINLPEAWSKIEGLLKLAKENLPAGPPEQPDKKIQGSAEVVHGHVSDQPAKEDKLDFGYYVDGIAEFLISGRTEAPLALSIEGPWGSGKSSFMMMLQDRLKKEGKPTVWFNAWRHDKAEAMCATFAIVFLGEMNKNLIQSFLRGVWFALTRQFARSKSYWMDFYRSLRGRFKLFWYRFNWTDGWMDVLRWAGIWLVFLVSLIAGGIAGWKGGFGLFDKLLENWQGADAQITETLTRKELLQIIGGTGGVAGVVTVLFSLLHMLKDWIGNPLEINLKKYVTQPDYEGNVQFIEKFHKDFEKIVRAYAGKQTVYVFIDDIDRCMVPKSADLMQALNMLICNSPNLIFIVGMDREKVAAGLAVKFEQLLPYLVRMPTKEAKVEGAKYVVPPEKAKEFGYNFIEKFIQLPFILPKPDESMIRLYMQKICGKKEDKDISGKQEESRRQPMDRVREDFPSESSSEGIVEKQVPRTINEDVSEPAVPDHAGIKPEERKKKEEIRERVDTDHELLCRVGEIAAEALENNPRRVKQFINLYRLRTYLASGRKLIKLPPENIELEDWTLEKLAKLVAVELRWPMFVREAIENKDLLRKMQEYALDPSKDKPDKWGEEGMLLEFLKSGCVKTEKIKDPQSWNLSGVKLSQFMAVTGGAAEQCVLRNNNSEL